jgi:hypothetical protein
MITYNKHQILEQFISKNKKQSYWTKGIFPKDNNT